VPEPQDEKPQLAAPELSVILVAGGQRKRATAALRSLLGQSIIDRIEILFFDLGPKDCPALPGSDHPRVRMTRGGPKDLSAARVQGVHAAHAPVVCFMEEHCEVQPGWAEATVLAHRGPWAGVGCDFINGNPNAGRSDKAFRMNYGVYVRPQRGRGPVKRIAGQNSAFKRDILLRYEPQLEIMMSADLVLQWKMARDGSQFFYEPTAKMAHRNENTLRSLCVGVFYWNWCFSNIRAEAFQWGFPRRALRIVLAPLIPWVRLVKMFIWTLRLGRSQFVQFVRDIPFVITVNHCAAAGQVAGLFNPVETGAREFSHFEMNEPRLLRAELTR
jgi:Glycosyl transferase family 2